MGECLTVDLGLAGRVAVVAGSTRGIGRAIAVGFAREGARVVVNGRATEQVEATVQAIEAETGATVTGVAADVSTAPGAAVLIEQARARFGGVDVLVTNAGGPPAGTFDEVTDEDFQTAFQLNLMSAVRLIRAAVPDMRERRWGRVINIASTAVKEPVPYVTLTNTIRPGVVGLAKDLADHLGPDGITVNTVLAGPVLTDRLRYTTAARAAAAGISEAEQWESYLKLVPLRRFGAPEDVAALVVFLAGEPACWITGTVIQADGGRIRSAT